MPNYNSTNFAPPAPIALVSVRNPQTGNVVSSVAMLLDTGADVTLIPQSVATQLGGTLDPDQRYALQSFDGTISAVPVMWLELMFCKRMFRGQFPVIDDQWGILGRNVLNSVALILDGPNLMWDEHDSLSK